MAEIAESDYYEAQMAGDTERMKGYLMPGTTNEYNIGLMVGDICWLAILNGGHTPEELMRFLDRYVNLIAPQLVNKYNA